MQYVLACCGLIALSVWELLVGSIWSLAFGRSEVPLVVASEGGAGASLLSHLPSLKLYEFPFWAAFPHAHVLVCHLLQSEAAHRGGRYQRTMAVMTDGVEVALDWKQAVGDACSTRPVVLIGHGLGGDTASPYIVILTQMLSERGYTSVVYNRRGHGGVPVSPPSSERQHRIYPQHFDEEDFKSVVQNVKQLSENRPIIGVGFSAGGNALACHLGCTGTESGLIAGVVVSNGYDVWRTVHGLKAKRPIFDSFLTHYLKELLRTHLPTLRAQPECKALDFDDVMKHNHLLDYESQFMPFLRGYNSAEEYYEDNSATLTRLKKISVPTLCLNALDDPIIVPELVDIPVAAALENSNIIAVKTRRGAHVSWLHSAGVSASRGSWMHNLIVEYVEAVARTHL